MKDICIIDSHETLVTGFTTYKEELFYCLKKIDNIRLTHVIFNAPADEFCIDQEGILKRIYIPVVKNVNNEKYYKIISFLLKLHIEDSPRTIFLQNYSPAAIFLEKLKKSHSLSKIIFVIHDFMWASRLLGDVNQYKNIICGKKKKNEFEPIYRYYYDNVASFNIADKILCLSQSTYNLLCKFYKIDPVKLSLIPNGLRDNYIKPSNQEKIFIRKEFKIDKKIKIILFAGRVTMAKGAYALIKCFNRVISRYPNCKLIIAGNFLSEELNSLFNSIQSNIILLGTINKKKLADWYKIADIGIIPSYYEQCSYSCIEMMQYGIPLVVSDGLGLDSMFNKSNAIIAKIGDRKDDIEYQENLASSLITMLESDYLKNKMSKESRMNYKTKYSISDMFINYNQLINNL